MPAGVDFVQWSKRRLNFKMLVVYLILRYTRWDCDYWIRSDTAFFSDIIFKKFDIFVICVTTWFIDWISTFESHICVWNTDGSIRHMYQITATSQICLSGSETFYEIQETTHRHLAIIWNTNSGAFSFPFPFKLRIIALFPFKTVIWSFSVVFLPLPLIVNSIHMKAVWLDPQSPPHQKNLILRQPPETTTS